MTQDYASPPQIRRNSSAVFAVDRDAALNATLEAMNDILVARAKLADEVVDMAMTLRNPRTLWLTRLYKTRQAAWEGENPATRELIACYHQEEYAQLMALRDFLQDHARNAIISTGLVILTGAQLNRIEHRLTTQPISVVGPKADPAPPAAQVIPHTPPAKANALQPVGRKLDLS